MADRVRVFVSRHDSPEEAAYTERLVAGLEAAGAGVWVNAKSSASGAFRRKINEGLDGRQWFVLLMSPAALRLKRVRREVGAAYRRFRSSGQGAASTRPVGRTRTGRTSWPRRASHGSKARFIQPPRQALRSRSTVAPQAMAPRPMSREEHRAEDDGDSVDAQWRRSRSATRAMWRTHIARVAQMVGHSHECEATLETKEHLSTPLNWRHYTIERVTITSGRLSRPVALVGQPAWDGDLQSR